MDSTASMSEGCSSETENVLKHFSNLKIFIHSDLKTLHEHVPKDMLPLEYGGSGCSLDEVNDGWMKKLADYTQWFTEQEDVKANELLRPGKPTNYDELFGIDGSFRQLSID